MQGLTSAWHKCQEDAASSYTSGVTRARRHPMCFSCFSVFFHLPLPVDAAPQSAAHTLHELRGHLCGHVPPLLMHSCFELLEVLQPLAPNRLCPQDHKFSIGLRSGLLKGQNGKRLMLAACCLFYLLMQAGAGLCALSLSCCNTQEEVSCCQKSLSPSGRSVDINTPMYSACVMFDEVVPFFVLYFDT